VQHVSHASSLTPPLVPLSDTDQQQQQKQQQPPPQQQQQPRPQPQPQPSPLIKQQRAPLPAASHAAAQRSRATLLSRLPLTMEPLLLRARRTTPLPMAICERRFSVVFGVARLSLSLSLIQHKPIFFISIDSYRRRSALRGSTLSFAQTLKTNIVPQQT
jgi:hypothetical protein